MSSRASWAASCSRPALVPFPSLAVRLLLGEMGQALLLDSTRVFPRRLERAAFRFRHPGLAAALRAALAVGTRPVDAG